MHARRFWIPLLLPLVLAAGCARKASTDAKIDSALRPVPVTVAVVERRPLETTIDVVGTLRGWENVKVGAKRAGRVLRTLHDVGDRVKPGEPLVQLDTVNADLMVQQAEKRLQSELAKLGLTELPQADFDVVKLPAVVQAQVGVDRAKQRFAREQTLAEKKVNTVESYQNAEFDLRDAQAALDNALLSARATLASAMASQVELDVARQNRADLETAAPQPSRRPAGLEGDLVYAMTKRMVAEGQMLREGEEVAELIIEHPLRMWANVPERFSPYVEAGQEVRLSVSSHPDRQFLGKIAWVNPSVDSSSRTFQIEVWVPNDQHELRPGGFAKASIVVRQHEERTIVPVEAIVRFAGVTKLFVVEGDKAVTIPVETSEEGEGWIAVEGRVPAGAQVVCSGQSKLADGTPVTIREPGAESASSAAAHSATAPAATPPPATSAAKPADATSG